MSERDQDVEPALHGARGCRAQLQVARWVLWEYGVRWETRVISRRTEFWLRTRLHAQFRTRYFVLYFDVTLLFVRAAMAESPRTTRSVADATLAPHVAGQPESCTNAVTQCHFPFGESS